MEMRSRSTETELAGRKTTLEGLASGAGRNTTLLLLLSRRTKGSSRLRGGLPPRSIDL